MAMAVAKKETQYTDGGNFKVKIGKTTYEVMVFFNGEKKVTAEERIKKLIQQDVKAGNF